MTAGSTGPAAATIPGPDSQSSAGSTATRPGGIGDMAGGGVTAAISPEAISRSRRTGTLMSYIPGFRDGPSGTTGQGPSSARAVRRSSAVRRAW